MLRPLALVRHTAPLALLLLFGCGPDRDQFAPVCPTVAFLQPAADLSVYRPGGNGRDLTDLQLLGRVESINGQCERGDDKNKLNTKVTVGVSLMRGPAMPGSQVNVPIFVAVTEGDRILDKHVYTLHGEFPSNVDRLTLASPEVDMTLPVSQTKSGAAYTVLAGFQLTPEQLAANRARAAGQ